MAGSGNPGALALIWENLPSGDGNAQVVGTGQGLRYDAWNYQDLIDVGLLNKISSVSLFTPANGATVLILYSLGQYSSSYQNSTRFNGDFLLIDNRTGSQFDLNLASVGMFGNETWNNCPSSLIVAHSAMGPELRLSAAQTLTPIWNTIIDQQLEDAGGKVDRDGAPQWEWIAYPISYPQSEHLNPSRNYLRVHQKVIVSPPAPIADYKASITYYLRLRPANGTVEGWVARWECWVESGVFSEFVGAILRPYTILGAERLNDFLTSGAIVPSGVNVSGLYYLPGTQTNATNPGEVHVFQGNCSWDATIVLQTG